MDQVQRRCVQASISPRAERRSLILALGDGVVSVNRFPNDLNVFDSIEYAFETFAHDSVIVCYEDANHIEFLGLSRSDV